MLWYKEGTGHNVTAGFLECKWEKWYCEERGSGRCFKKGKVLVEWEREVLWFRVNGFIFGVEEIERARKGVTILLNDVWHSAVIDFGCVSSRILWVKFNFSKLKVCVEMLYAPLRERFWN